MAEEQIPSLVQGLVERFYDTFFGKLVKVNDHITAKDHIHLAEQSQAVLVKEVEMAYGYQFPDLVVYFKRAILFLEITLDIDFLS